MAENEVIPLKHSVQVPVKEQSKYPTEIVPLPTKGWFYPEESPLASGEVEVKQMSAREEDLLANQELIKKGKVLDKLLESLIVDKSIKIEDILVPDKNAIFLAIRRLAYGDDYPVSITCPACSGQNKISINLAELKYREFNFDGMPRGQNSFEFTLPNSNVKVTYKLLNQIDESSIEAELNSFKKISKEASKDLTTRLIYVITSINDNPDKKGIRAFVNDQLTARDSLALRRHMGKHNPDVDMTFDFKCSTCDIERRIDVPIGATFLWPDIEA